MISNEHSLFLIVAETEKAKINSTADLMLAVGIFSAVHMVEWESILS